jgi:hypothetical protein
VCWAERGGGRCRWSCAAAGRLYGKLAEGSQAAAPACWTSERGQGIIKVIMAKFHQLNLLRAKPACCCVTPFVAAAGRDRPTRGRAELGRAQFRRRLWQSACTTASSASSAWRLPRCGVPCLCAPLWSRRRRLAQRRIRDGALKWHLPTPTSSTRTRTHTCSRRRNAESASLASIVFGAANKTRH